MLCTKRSGVFFLLELPDTRIRRFPHRQNKCFLSFLNKQKYFSEKDIKNPTTKTVVGFSCWRCRPDLNWCVAVLQTAALPLGYGTVWSGLRGSNSLPPPWQGGALPDELNPQKKRTYSLTASPLSCIYITIYHLLCQHFFYFFCIHFSNGFSRPFLLASQPRFVRITAKGQSSF